MDYSKNIDDLAISSLFCVKMIEDDGYFIFLFKDLTYSLSFLCLFFLLNFLYSSYLSDFGLSFAIARPTKLIKARSNIVFINKYKEQ